MLKRREIVFFRQPDTMYCGPTCLKMICWHYGVRISLDQIGKLSESGRQGTSLENISNAAEKIGFRTLGLKIESSKLAEVPLPCILHWNQNHFVVLYKVKRDKFYIADPAHGKITLTRQEFLEKWIGGGILNKEPFNGIALLFEPTQKLRFNHIESEKKKLGFSFLINYLSPHKRFVSQLVLGLFLGSLIQLIFPFLTQSVVDIGIQNNDVQFIYLVLFAQLFLFLGSSSIGILRGWIILHLSTRINIALISDFFIKLMNLPISFFDSKMTGDLLQRINDHKRIENLLTTQSLNILFSFFNLIVFGAVLAWFNLSIFFIYLIGSSLYIIWLVLFLNKRREIDYRRFAEQSSEQSKVIELISGMQEIKLHNAEKQKRWNWESIQIKLFKTEMKYLRLQQFQSTGSNLINEIKNILMTILSAKLVIDGQISLGTMLAITYIIGQLNVPLHSLLNLLFTFQDAKIALERLSEIHNKEDEETDLENKISDVSTDNPIELKNISFRYLGAQNNVIEDLTLSIPSKKITAIVGASGSGKTTLMKMLLKFYEPHSGEIKIGGNNLNNISQSVWRELCGVVMQEGYIFNDTIANNIAIGQGKVNHQKLIRAVEVASIKDFVDELPLGFNTKVGMEGVGMSTGQKQRLLIARAVYKNPEIICFDEATSALDAKNERVIMENLNEFFKDRTAIVIAHRLSTVKKADQIVVLDEGKIIEKGTHDDLIALKGSYFNLVKNQLQLENIS